MKFGTLFTTMNQESKYQLVPRLRTGANVVSFESILVPLVASLLVPRECSESNSISTIIIIHLTLLKIRSPRIEKSPLYLRPLVFMSCYSDIRWNEFSRVKRMLTSRNLFNRPPAAGWIQFARTRTRLGLGVSGITMMTHMQASPPPTPSRGFYLRESLCQVLFCVVQDSILLKIFLGKEMQK